MRATVVLAAAVVTGSVFAGQQIEVSLCNPGTLTESVLRRAMAEAQAAFRAAQVTIEWSDCHQLEGRHPFIVRLRADKPPRTAGPLSLDAMGRAFLSTNGRGYLVDAYIQSVRDISKYHGADDAAVLGVV